MNGRWGTFVLLIHPAWMELGNHERLTYLVCMEGGEHDPVIHAESLEIGKRVPIMTPEDMEGKGNVYLRWYTSE